MSDIEVYTISNLRFVKNHPFEAIEPYLVADISDKNGKTRHDVDITLFSQNISLIRENIKELHTCTALLQENGGSYMLISILPKIMDSDNQNTVIYVEDE